MFLQKAQNTKEYKDHGLIVARLLYLGKANNQAGHIVALYVQWHTLVTPHSCLSFYIDTFDWSILALLRFHILDT